MKYLCLVFATDWSLSSFSLLFRNIQAESACLSKEASCETTTALIAQHIMDSARQHIKEV